MGMTQEGDHAPRTEVGRAVLAEMSSRPTLFTMKGMTRGKTLTKGCYVRGEAGKIPRRVPPEWREG